MMEGRCGRRPLTQDCNA